MSDERLPVGSNYCLCSGCGRYFAGVKPFERHRHPQGEKSVCLPPTAMSEGGFWVNSKGYWSGPRPKKRK